MDRIREYIAQQPEVLLRTLHELPHLLKKATVGTEGLRAITLVGSGTSRNALEAVRPALAAATGLPVEVAGPLGFLYGAGKRRHEGVLGVFLSQTGTSTTTVEALVRAQEQGMPTIALTAEGESPFGRAAHQPVVIPIGAERIGPKTKGYTASVAALLALAGALSPEASPPVAADPERFAAAYAGRLETWDALGRELAERCRGGCHVMLLGSERHVGTALEASLKIQEMSGQAASAFDTEEGLHGRFHGLGADDLTVFLAASPREAELARAAAAVLDELGIGALLVRTDTADDDAAGNVSGELRIWAIPPLPGAAPELDLATIIVPFQYGADHLARAHGVDPDEMRYPRLSAKLGIKLST